MHIEMEKQEFVEKLKKWVVLDRHTKSLQEKLREIRDQKNDLADSLQEYMDTNHIRKPIELSDGNIRIVERKEYTPLSFSFVEECLDELISNKEHVDTILDHLRDKREVRVVREIKRS